jgi:hypothetical protein
MLGGTASPLLSNHAMLLPLLMVLLGGLLSTLLAVLSAHLMLSRNTLRVVARADGPDTGSCATAAAAKPGGDAVAKVDPPSASPSAVERV